MNRELVDAILAEPETGAPVQVGTPTERAHERDRQVELARRALRLVTDWTEGWLDFDDFRQATDVIVDELRRPHK